MDENKLFKNSTEFSLYIEKKVVETKQTYVECILEFCETNFVEPEDIKSLINKSLKDKIAQELIESNYFPKKATLEF